MVFIEALYHTLGGVTQVTQPTNEELVKLIRDGQYERMSELYEKNRGMVYQMARRYARIRVSPAVDMDDFMQTGYLALAAAVAAYDEGRGKFTTLLHICLRQHMQLLCGLQGARKAHNGAVSLDESIPGADGELTRAETIIDDKAVNPCEAAELEDLRRVVREAVGRLPDLQRRAVEDYYFKGLRYRLDHPAYGTEAALRGKALMKLRRDIRLKQLVTDSITPIYRHVSLNSYRSTYVSAVEWAAMKREELLKQLKKISLHEAMYA